MTRIKAPPWLLNIGLSKLFVCRFEVLNPNAGLTANFYAMIECADCAFMQNVKVGYAEPAITQA